MSFEFIKKSDGYSDPDYYHLNCHCQNCNNFFNVEVLKGNLVGAIKERRNRYTVRRLGLGIPIKKDKDHFIMCPHCETQKQVYKSHEL